MTDVFKPAVGTFRTIFLYVGQGDSSLMMIPDGNGHKFALIDSNKDEKNGGIDVASFLKGKIPNGELIFINTHPHNDHVRGIDEIRDIVGEVWETGFEPGEDNTDAKKILDELVPEKNVYYLRGTNKINTLSENGTEEGKETHKLGDVDYQVFSPSTYVADDVNGDDNKIHEQCGVMKFVYKDKSVLITGDSDKKAWIDHITPYHGDVLQAEILSASHHGSRSFFKNGEDDKEPYEEHIEKINPEYLVISAPPKGKDSQFDHPHDDAMEIYKKYISEENIFNLGENKQSLMVDIDSDGNISTEWVDISSENEDQDKSASLYPYRPTSASNVRPFCAV